jgi:hypothetical protein
MKNERTEGGLNMSLIFVLKELSASDSRILNGNLFHNCSADGKTDFGVYFCSSDK